MGELTYIIFLILFLLIGILIIILINLEKILGCLDKRIENMRDFVRKNEGFFSICFILTFAFEQAILMILINFFGANFQNLQIIVSLFALVVIGTASLQKLLIETKRKYDKKTKEELEYANETVNELKDFIMSLKKEIKLLKKGN